MKNYIIGIAGHKDSGKDITASMINYIFAVGVTKAKYMEWRTKRESFDITYADRIFHFADPLKDILSILYNIPRSCFDSRKYKDEYWYCFETNSFLDTKTVSGPGYNIISFTNLDNHNTIKDVLTTHDKMSNVIKLRTLMQYFGTDICREQLSNDIWIRCGMSKIVDKAISRRICIVPDVRFANEANAIKHMDSSLYGGIIMLKRNNNDNSEHSSEIIDFTADYKIDNNGTIMNLFYGVLDIVSKILNK